MTLKIDAKFEEKLNCFKNDKNLVNFTRELKSLKICTFNGFYYAKYLIFDLK